MREEDRTEGRARAELGSWASVTMDWDGMSSNRLRGSTKKKAEIKKFGILFGDVPEVPDVPRQMCQKYQKYLFLYEILPWRGKEKENGQKRGKKSLFFRFCDKVPNFLF